MNQTILQQLENILAKIIADPRYIEGITYGVPRKGQDEGTPTTSLNWKLTTTCTATSVILDRIARTMH